MRTILSTLLIAILLATLACSAAYSAQNDVWLAGYLLLRIKAPGEGQTLQQRVDTVQLRANDLLALSNTLPKVSVKHSRTHSTIIADGKLFMNVTAADARADGKSVQKLANYWAQRLRTILPDATPIKH